MLVKTILRGGYLAGLKLFLVETDSDSLRHSSVVFAPHPDDETLGCGGTIVLKKIAGANLCIVFMTDGSASHRNMMPGDILREIRKREALAACQKLGVTAADVEFLDFEDGKLGMTTEAATERVLEILSLRAPKEIFIPYNRDQVSDHVHTNQIVLAALRRLNTEVTVNEYPIWFWGHWPWMEPRHRQQSLWKMLKTTFHEDLGCLLRDFRHATPISTVLEVKRTALEQHRSQMTRLIPDKKWPILADVSNGEFLACFFRDHEFFKRYAFQGEFQPGCTRGKKTLSG